MPTPRRLVRCHQRPRLSRRPPCHRLRYPRAAAALPRSASRASRSWATAAPTRAHRQRCAKASRPAAARSGCAWRTRRGRQQSERKTNKRRREHTFTSDGDGRTEGGDWEHRVHVSRVYVSQCVHTTQQSVRRPTEQEGRAFSPYATITSLFLPASREPPPTPLPLSLALPALPFPSPPPTYPPAHRPYATGALLHRRGAGHAQGSTSVAPNFIFILFLLRGKLFVGGCCERL